MIENSQKCYILDQHWWLVCFPVFCLCFIFPKSIQICFFWVLEYLWLITDLNISWICFMIKNSQKWHTVDQLVCFPVFYVCFVFSKSIQIWFFLGSRMFVIKSKYSSFMFYDWKFSQKAHSGSVMMACIFPVFCVCFACLNSIHICVFHIKISLQKLHFTRIFQMW